MKGALEIMAANIRFIVFGYGSKIKGLSEFQRFMAFPYIRRRKL